MRWHKSKKFLTAFITSRYLPFIWLIHTGWQTQTRPEQPPEINMATKRRPSMRTRMKVEDVSSWVEHNQQPPAYAPTPSEEPNRVRFRLPRRRSKSCSSSGSNKSLKIQPVYLDGGYGWLIVLFSFLIHSVLDGSSFCMGISYVAIQKDYGVGRVTATYPASFYLSIPLLVSPFVGLFSDVFGCRASILVGSLIASISCFLSLFCTDIYLFTLTFGVGCGIGMSFLYNAAVVIVTYYFDQKRGIATSWAVSGTGIGTLLFPGYMRGVTYLIQEHVGELRTYVICFMAGYLGIVVIGLFIKDVRWTSDQARYKVLKFEKQVKQLMEDRETNLKNKEQILRHAISLPNLYITRPEPGSITSLCEVGVDGKSEMPTRSKSVAMFEDQRPSMPTIPEYSMLNTRLSNLEHLDLELANSPCNTVKATRRRVVSKTSMSVDQINEMDDDEDFKINILTSTDSTESDESSSDDSEMSNDGDSSSSELSEKVIDPPTPPINRKPNPVGFNRSTSSAPNSARVNRNSLAQGTTNYYGGRVMAGNAIQGRFASNLLTMGKVPSAPMLVYEKKKQSFFERAKFDDLAKRFKVEFSHYPKVFKNPAFCWVLSSVFFLYLVLDVPYVYFYDYAIDDLKISETAGNGLYSVIGLTNFFFTIIYGKIADLRRNSVGSFYAASMLLVTLSMVLAVFAETPSRLITCAVIFGSSVTANYALQSILVTVCFGDMDIFQAAYSMMSMIEGIASFIGPTFIFAPLREYTGSYKVVFAIGAASSFLSAATMLAFHITNKRRAEEEEKEEKEEEGQGENRISDSKKLQNGNGVNHETQVLLSA